MWTDSPTYYDLLHVQPAADATVIKAAYRARLKQLHPDMGGSAEATIALTEAYQVLADGDRRAQYDRKLGTSWWQADEVAQASYAAYTSSRSPTDGKRPHERALRVGLTAIVVAGYLASLFHM